MPNLYPTFPSAPKVDIGRAQPPTYKKSVLFDFEAGEFVLDGGARVRVADGQTAWQQWCIKAILTARFAFLSYGQYYGSEVNQILKSYPTKEAREAEIRRDITETLMVDPRTAMVKDFSFSWTGEDVYVSCRAVPVIGESQTLGVTLHG